VDEDGGVNTTPVRTGITDGQFTEIQGPEIEEKMQIIAAVTSSSGSTEANNPFQNPQTQRFRGPRGVM
jgi:hypothetical protein